MRGAGWGHERPPVPGGMDRGPRSRSQTAVPPKAMRKAKCPLRLRLNSGAALTFFLSLAGKGLSVVLAQHDGGLRRKLSNKKGPAEAGPSIRGNIAEEVLWGLPQRTTPRAGIGSTKEKPRRVTGLRVMVGPVGLATNPTRSRSRANASELGRRQAVLAIGHNAEFNVRHALLGPSARNEYRGESRHYPLRRTQGTEKQAGPPRCPEEEYRPPYP